jgi:hypothetical protein
MKPTIRVDWRAGRDGVAHAHPPRRERARAVCGRERVAPLLAWPERERCRRCLDRLESLARLEGLR